MGKFIILPDVTCDLSYELRERFGVKDYIPGYVQINGENLTTTLDWQNISRENFYKTLENKKNRVTSAAPNPEDYYKAFKKYVEQGYAVLSISISSKISSTLNFAKLGAEKVRAEFPDCNIYCFDSLRMSGAMGLLVIYACLLQQQGKTFEEVIAFLEENKHKVHQMGPIDDLTFIARRGKISKGKAFMGNLIGIKPMGDCNADGYVTVLAKVKGIKNALVATTKYLQRVAVDLENQYVFISHSNRSELATTLANLVKEQVKCKDVLVCDVFSGCGTNIGPGMVGLYFLGEPVTADSTKEKETLTACIEEC